VLAVVAIIIVVVVAVVVVVVVDVVAVAVVVIVVAMKRCGSAMNNEKSDRAPSGDLRGARELLPLRDDGTRRLTRTGLFRGERRACPTPRRKTTSPP